LSTQTIKDEDDEKPVTFSIELVSMGEVRKTIERARREPKSPVEDDLLDICERRCMSTQTIKELDFQAPIRTVSEANQREHWALKNQRKRDQQQEMFVVLMQNLAGKKMQLPCIVKLTRIGPKALDTDNLAGAMKHVQDAIARKLGVDDGDAEKVKWEYSQMPIRIREYAVKVSIRSVSK
jgi:hypothetical protein